MSARYEVRDAEPGEYGRASGVEKYYDVWDNALSKRVPFGRHRSLQGAFDHLERVKRRMAREEPTPPET